MDSISIMRNVKDASETFLPNGMSGFKEASKATIGILGSGDFAKSLAIRFIRSGYAVVIGSRNPKRAVGFFPPLVEIVHQEDAVMKTNLIFVAMHREHYTSLWDLKHLLVGKILVDVSNNVRINQYAEANAEYLASLFPNSTVVKGFNVISAWALQFGPKDANRQIYICSNVVEARQQIIELARQLDFIPVDMGTLASAKEIENMPLHLFTLWKGPVLVAIGLSIFFYIYSFIRDIVHPYVKNKQSDFYKIPIEIVNKTLPVVAITLLSLVYLAGLLASAFQLNSGTKYRRFPTWLEHWLQCRKQLGLLSFFFASVHTIYSLCLPMRRSERYFFLNMAYQQSTLGYVALLISTFHVLIYGWKRAFEEQYYRFYTPPNFMLALILPFTVIIGKLILLFPCINRRLRKIRKGWEKSQLTNDTSTILLQASPERVTVM
ncbi:metalloreductase STEAP2 isoform X3 [Stegostoma tigrinum]|uniref:metalloreductase STEAP2 isoform X3 n=1 Tax=Stegostoma tigrinum TaxID=3053191 RepID=UPI0028701458|nr:metalloreductase STEAP2 isoform X3 [Stegostoma tigrinum]